MAMLKIERNARLLMLLSLVALAACGQKGPLYLPGNPSEIRTEVPKQVPATTDKTDEESDDSDDPDNPPK